MSWASPKRVTSEVLKFYAGGHRRPAGWTSREFCFGGSPSGKLSIHSELENDPVEIVDLPMKTGDVP